MSEPATSTRKKPRGSAAVRLRCPVLHDRLGHEGRTSPARHLARHGLADGRSGVLVQSLTVCDEGDRLAICFGPLPLFQRRFQYDDILGVEIGRTTIMDGWGIHWTPGVARSGAFPR